MCHIYLPATDVIDEYLAAISPGVSYLVGGTLPTCCVTITPAKL